jgi:hypothetical protein
MKKRMKLIDNWKHCYKMFSVILAMLLAALSAAQTMLPSFQTVVPAEKFAWVSMIVSVAIAIARVIKQEALPEGSDDASKPADKSSS